MRSLTTGTLAGTGSFRCEECGYVVTLAAEDVLPACPGCNGDSFVRASLFTASTLGTRVPEGGGEDRDAVVAAVRDSLEGSTQYLAWREGDDVRIVPLEREWTRIGRSLAADVRFDDPTVSRRHALIVRQPDGVRVLDDRSLNGVFVNGERITSHTLRDGDEILIGRYRLRFVELAPTAAATSSEALRAE